MTRSTFVVPRVSRIPGWEEVARRVNVNLVLGAFAVLGGLLVLIVTTRYGAGLTPDSVAYISTARNLIAGRGFLIFSDDPLITWPPLYPLMLAVGSLITHMDAREIAPFLNSILFGSTLYVTGRLVWKLSRGSLALTVVCVLAVLSSWPFFTISWMAYSELLFIFLILVSISLMQGYLEKRDGRWLVLAGVTTALAALTRYIGISLIFWGILVLLLTERNRPRSALVHAAAFLATSTLPLCVWLFRNYSLVGALFGPRQASQLGLIEAVREMIAALSNFYFPGRLINTWWFLPALFILLAVLVFSLMQRYEQKAEPTLTLIVPLALFVLVYVGCLLATSTILDHSPVAGRLVAPIAIPLTLVLILGAWALIMPLSARYSPSLVKLGFYGGVGFWILYPLSVTTSNAVAYSVRGGDGYNSQSWQQNETIQYVTQQLPVDQSLRYSNDPWALYILASQKAKLFAYSAKVSPEQLDKQLDELALGLPNASHAYLICFDCPVTLATGHKMVLGSGAQLESRATLKDGIVFELSSAN